MGEYSKIVYYNKTLIDLTADTVEEDKLLEGITAHDKAGNIITGTCTFDSDTSNDTVTAAEMLAGKTAHARGIKMTGTMPNNGAVNGEIETVGGEYNVPQGYHDGSGKVRIAADEQAKLIPANIRQGVEVLGVTGTMSSQEGVKAQVKTVTPKATSQQVTPDEGYTHLSQVTVAAIPYVESENSAGGITVTIG